MNTPASTYLGSYVSIFRRLDQKNQIDNAMLSDVLGWIKFGEFKDDIETLRKLSSHEKKDYKTGMNAFSPSGTLFNRKIKHHIGLVQLDFDGVSNPESLKSSLFMDDHVLMACISPSGDGVKGLCTINPENHKSATKEAQEYFSKAYPLDRMDTAPMSAHSLFIFSHDPEIMIKESSTRMKTFTGDDEIVSLRPSQSQTKSQTQSQTQHTDTDLSVTKTISYTYASKPNNLFKRSMEKLKILPRCHKTEERLLSKNLSLKRIWKTHVSRGLDIDFSKRNESLVKLVSRCFYRLGKDQVMLCSETFHKVYEPFFNDSLDRHMKESEEMWKIMDKSYLNHNPEERDMYDCLTQEFKDVYRICRNLAENKDKIDPPYFPLSGDQLGIRIGKTRSIGAEFLNHFSSTGIIEVAEKGEAWGQGKKPKANIWKWCLPLLSEIDTNDRIISKDEIS